MVGGVKNHSSDQLYWAYGRLHSVTGWESVHPEVHCVDQLIQHALWDLSESKGVVHHPAALLQRADVSLDLGHMFMP